MNVDDDTVQRLTLVAWAALAVVWFALAVTDSTGGLTASPTDLAVGLALVLGIVAAVAVTGTDAQARLLVVGGTAVVLSVVDPGWIPVATETLSLLADLSILGAMLLILSSRVDDVAGVTA